MVPSWDLDQLAHDHHAGQNFALLFDLVEPASRKMRKISSGGSPFQPPPSAMKSPRGVLALLTTRSSTSRSSTCAFTAARAPRRS